MNRNDAIRLLKEVERELRARGVRSLALFGSMARGDAGPGSDVDVLIDLDMTRQPSLVDFCATRLLIEDKLGCTTDLAIRDDLRATYRIEIEADAIPIFGWSNAAPPSASWTSHAPLKKS
jgi:predicted nucleotidyltransferase